MNTIERAALLVHRDTIVQSVDLVYIKEKLIAYGIINNEELEEIDYEVSLTLILSGLCSSLNIYLEN